MSVTVELIPGCVPPERGTGRVLVMPDARGEWVASWQGGLDVTVRSNERFSVTCTTEAEALAWALAQPAAEWMICRDRQAGFWEHLR